MTTTWIDQGVNSKNTQKLSHTRGITLTTSTPDWLVIEAVDASNRVIQRASVTAGSLPQLLIDVFWFVDMSGSMTGTPSQMVDASFSAMQTQLGALGASTTIQRYGNASWAENVMRDFYDKYSTVTSLRRPGSTCHIIGATDTGIHTESDKSNATPGLIRQLRATGPADLWMYAVAGGEGGDAIGSSGYDHLFIDLYGNKNNMLRDTSSIVAGIVSQVKPVTINPVILSNIPDSGTFTVRSYLSTSKTGTAGGGNQLQLLTESVSTGDRTPPNFNITVTETYPSNTKSY